MAAGPSLSRRGSFTCHHGEEDKRPPIDEDTLRDRSRIEHTITEFYVEAARRLPLDEIPELLRCVQAGGLCFGLADPVTNIILNTIALLPIGPDDGRGPVEDQHPPAMNRREGTSPSPDLWMFPALSSLFGLHNFMAAYFRYLTETQARRYLHLASYDLPLAMKLVRHERHRSSSSPSPKPLLPDGGRIKAALRVAALKARHPAPDDMARLMTARYPSHLLAPVVASLQQHGHQLSAGEVWAIRDLLARPWPPNAPTVNIEFLCRPPDGHTRTAPGGDAATLLQLSSCLAEDEDLVARVTVERRDLSQSHRHIPDLTFDNSAYMETKLSNCLAMVATGKEPTAATSTAAAVDYDASPCEHVQSLKMCLLDALRGVYIKALTVLPRSPRLVRALLASGHCYGPMDPVSNVILSTVWYDAAFPGATQANRGESEGSEVEEADILETAPMSRLECRSLDGLVAFLRAANTDPPLSELEAVEELYFYDCDVSGHLEHHTSGSCSTEDTGAAIPVSFAAAAMAARHPEHAAFGSFLASLVLFPEKLTRLRSLLLEPAGGRISDAHWRRLAAFIGAEASVVRHAISVSAQQELPPPCSLLGQTSEMMFRMNSPPYTSVRTQLDDMLRKYCNQHPWEPSYRLDIICGVWESKNPGTPKLCHANFLASTDGEATGASPHEHTLFFAEFWEWRPSSPPLVQTEAPSCCPVYDYSSCGGRCSYCETEANGIVHPPSGSHSGSYIDVSMYIYSSAKRRVLSIGFEGLP